MKINIPCCIATKEIPDQETFDKVFSLLEEAGGIVYEDYDYSEYKTLQWLGIEKDNNDIYLFDHQSSFSEHCDASEVTVYSLEDLLGKQPETDEWIEWKGGEQPVPSGTMVCVKYLNGAESIVTAGLYSQDADFKRISGTLLALDWNCSSYGGVPTDIVAYKIYKKPSSLPKSTPSGETKKSSTLVPPEGEKVIMQEIDSKKLTAGDEVKIVSNKSSHGYCIGDTVTLLEFTSYDQNSQYNEDYWSCELEGDVWDVGVSEFVFLEGTPVRENTPKLSPVDFGAIPDTCYGATAKVQIELRLGDHNESLVISRDNAYKIYKDLKRIFKKEIS